MHSEHTNVLFFIKSAINRNLDLSICFYITLTPSSMFFFSSLINYYEINDRYCINDINDNNNGENKFYHYHHHLTYFLQMQHRV